MGEIRWCTSPEQRAGLYVAVISGGRPLLKQRPTNHLLPSLIDAGFRTPEWIVSSRDAPAYEQDGVMPVNVYDQGWAYEYAQDHWLNPTDPPVRDGFLGAFPGREWAAREAEKAGCWGVLMLDDNILPQLRFLRGSGASIQVVKENGNLGLYADLLSALALSTNAAMIGSQLAAAIPSVKESAVILRPGFTYSLFIEKIAGREPWHGPYEEDIQQAFTYGDRADGVTCAVVPLLTYIKEHASKTGMRTHRSDGSRAVALQRLVPQSASITVKKTRSNGKGQPRIFHHMTAGAIRNPVRVHDPGLFGAARDRLIDLRKEWYALELERNKAKVRKRTESYVRRQQEAANG